MSDNNRVFLRLEDCLRCTFTYTHFDKKKVGKGTIMDISGGGLRMVSKDIVRIDDRILIDVDPPLGPLSVQARVLDTQMECYVTDRQRDMFWTIRTQFVNIPIHMRKKIIAYVYTCKTERRKAEITRLRPSQ